jgi:hypothetical protein
MIYHLCPNIDPWLQTDAPCMAYPFPKSTSLPYFDLTFAPKSIQRAAEVPSGANLGPESTLPDRVRPDLDHAHLTASRIGNSSICTVPASQADF